MEKKMTIYDLGNAERELEDLLYENGGELTPEIEEALQDNEESLRKKADGYSRICRELLYHAQNCKEESQRMAEKAKRAENAAKRLKSHVLEAMQRFGWDKFEGSEVKFSIRNTESLDVDEEKVLSDANVGELIAQMELPAYIEVTATVNKTVIKDGVKKEGYPMPEGCRFVTNQSLNMR